MKVASSARHQAGFTLLEVLLVAMLMGLVATAVTLSMGKTGLVTGRRGHLHAGSPGVAR
jgi:type II secretion system protein H